MNCNSCDKRKLCKEPCEWLKKELKKTETYQVHKTYSNLIKLEEIIEAKKLGRKLPHIQDECDQVFSRESPFS